MDRQDQEQNCEVEAGEELVPYRAPESADRSDASGPDILVSIPLDKVIVMRRHRLNPNGITELAASIKEHGLLLPIAVTANYELICGFRRLLAHKLLGLPTINALVKSNIREIEDILAAEAAENVMREQPVISDFVHLAQTYLVEVEKAARRRECHSGEAAPEAQGPGSVLPQVGRALDIVAKAVAMSRGTLTKALEIVKAAESDPARFGDLLEKMDRTGKVSAAHNTLLDRKAAPEADSEAEEPRRCTVRLTRRGVFQMRGNLAMPEVVELLRELADRLAIAA